jgi:hypothetical protein
MYIIWRQRIDIDEDVARRIFASKLAIAVSNFAEP